MGIRIVESKNFVQTDKLACFDLDSTIIKTKTGNTFPINNDDWKLFNDNVPKVMKDLQDEKYCIIVFTNQKNLKDLDGFETKIKNIFKNIGVEYKFFISHKDNQYRKPMPFSFRSLNIKPSNESFYCGDAGGRKYDFSDTDYKFAKNIGLEFKLPEEIFKENKKYDKDIKIDYPELKNIGDEFKHVFDVKELVLHHFH